jgi:uncharacterized protein (TIRG00374 family)
LLTNRRLWLGVAGTALFLGLFFWRTDIRELADALAEANYWWVAPAIGVWFVSAWFRAQRWHYLLRHIERISPGSLYPIVIIGYMANNLLPLRTGELVRAYVLGERHRVSRMSALGTIALERLFDGVVLLGFLVLVGAFVGLNSDLSILAIAVAAGFAVILVVFLAVASSQERARGLISLLVRLSPQRFRGRAQEWAQAFVHGLGCLQSPWASAAVLLTTTVAWLLEALMYYLVGLSFNIGEGFHIYLMVTAAANLAITLPSTSGGIGPFELLAKETLVFAGVGTSLAAAYAIALHGLLLLPVIVAGLYFLWAINLSLGQVLRQPVTSALPVGERAE